MLPDRVTHRYTGRRGKSSGSVPLRIVWVHGGQTVGALPVVFSLEFVHGINASAGQQLQGRFWWRSERATGRGHAALERGVSEGAAHPVRRG
jgi:hypothetical protein